MTFLYILGGLWVFATVFMVGTLLREYPAGGRGQAQHRRSTEPPDADRAEAKRGTPISAELAVEKAA